MVVSKKVSQALQRGAFVKQGAKEDCDWKQVILNAELSECQCSTTLSVTCKFLSLDLSLDFLTGGGVELYALPNMFICSCTIERNRESSGSVLKQISYCSHRYILTLLTITNSPKMLTNRKKRGKFKFPQSLWILGQDIGYECKHLQH